MSTPHDIAMSIENKVGVIQRERPKLSGLAEEKARANAEYEKQLAIVLLKLKNADIAEWNGIPVGKIPASIMQKVAQGIAYESKIQADIAESAYKSHVLKLDAIKAELNALQSIYRHLDTV